MAGTTFLLADFTGGESDLHPVTLADRQVAIAQDLDYYRCTLGGRRNGSVLVVSGLAHNINALIVYQPLGDQSGALWALDEHQDWTTYDVDYVPSGVTPSPADTFDASLPVDGATLHGKLFIAASTLDAASGLALDRLHVWDGGVLRRTGLAAPPDAPAVADTGSGGFTGTRYYRVRFIEEDADGLILRRSEPSPETTFTPSGAGSAAQVTIPTLVGEGETHWEVEESDDIDTGNWYRIATVAIGTTTYDDTIELPQDVPITDGVALSADIGDYSLQHSYRFVIADRDRILGAGNFTDTEKDSDVEWSVVGTDTTGVGNDERVPTKTGNRLALDGKERGPITAFKAFDGRIVGFKANRVYSLTNSGNIEAAYQMQIVSTTYGAIAGSAVEGTDAQGRAAIYFVDPELGPMRYGANGFEVIAPHLQDKFASEVNWDARYRIVNAVYHPGRGQVWWHFAGLRKLARGCCPPAPITPDWPSFRWCYDIAAGEGVATGAGGASSFHSLPRLCRATVFFEGKPILTAEGGALVRADEDEAPDDYGYTFRAYTRSRAYELGNLIQRFEVSSAMVEGRAIALSPGRRFGCATPSGVNLIYTLIRDYGKETRSVQFNLDQEGNEQYVIKALDNAHIAEATAVQVEIGDVEEVSQAPWQLFRTAWVTKSNGPNVS